MKKASKVFKSIRFAKLDPNHDKGPKGSSDDEEHYAVSSQEFQQQVDHVKKRAMQEAKIKVNFKMPPESVAERLAREHAARRKASGLPDPSHYKQMAAQKQKEIDAMKEEVESLEEEHLVHVSDGSKYGDEPDAKDTEHVVSGLKKHGGTYDGASDKGAYFKFKSHDDAKNFKNHVDRCPNRSCHADLHEEVEIEEDLRKWFDKNDPEGGWKRINSKGEAIGPCAREEGEPKPKCMSNEKRASLTKKERAAAVASKRKHDPDADRKGKPINVSNFGKGKISEDMENLEEKNVPTSPEKWAQAKAQAKAKFDVYPSAYANGWAAKKYKSMGGGWKSVSEESEHLDEGRASQRHPLEGHEYHKKTNAELEYIAKDAHKAAEAMKGHNTTAENKYRDQANDSATVRYFRKKSGTPDWYKKKYGLNEAKEKTEYDYEGDMARGQLQSIINNAQRVHDMLEDNDNLPEWVQSKITLAEDYISTVANYMMSEIDEAVNSFVPSPNATPVAKKPKDEYDRKVDKYLKQKYSPPFDPPYKKSTGGTVTDKSGAKHTPMSRARDLARNAMKKQTAKVSESTEEMDEACWTGYRMKGMKNKGGRQVPNCVPESVQIQESRKAQIVREAVKKAKEKNKGNDKFEPEPELNSQVQKVDNV